MNHDINIKKLRVNCFRQSKIKGEFMLQLRVPGTLIDAKHLETVVHIAKTWGNGTFHPGMRQTLNIPGIKYENINAVNDYIKDYIKAVEIEACGVDMESNSNGYPTIGARNITACIGNIHCIKANINTAELAKKIEKLVFPSHYHIKTSIAGCPNDCAKAHFCDMGVVGIAIMDYDYDRCVGCGACTRSCQALATGVLTLNADDKIDKDSCCCVGCGECVLACPVSAWTRRPTKYYRLMLGARTGKQYPRMAKVFLNWVTEEVILGVFGNWQKFSKHVLGNHPLYLHGGHLIDIAGYNVFRDMILEGVELNPEAKVAERIYWDEIEYRANIHVKPIALHKKIGIQAAH